MYRKTKNKLSTYISIATLLTALLLPAYNAFAQESSTIYAYGTDTVAGYSALVTSSKIKSNESIYFYVTKPDGSIVKIPATSNDSGVAKVDLYDYHTRNAGQYGVSGGYASSGTHGPTSYFKVYSDAFAADVSRLVSNTGVAIANGQDEIYVTAQLKDKYGNPLQGHTVTLISSRAQDSIKCKSIGYLTDTNGSITYAVSSAEKGVSVYTAVDSTSGQALTERAKIAFLTPSAYTAEIGGDLLNLFPTANAAGSLHHFSFSDIPSEIAPNQDVTFTVTAQDIDDLTVENYTGTVHFSAEGSNSEYADLPDDFKFEASDLGEHTFSLGLSFSTEGSYKIVSTDLSNPAVKGDYTVIVGSGGSGDSGSSTPGSLSLLTPVSGTYSQAVQTVSGSAPANANIRIYDNDQEIGSVEATVSGNYSYQTAPLADGAHEIYVVALDDSSVVIATSESADVMIDTTAPTIDEIDVVPGLTVTPSTSISIDVASEVGLSQAAAIFNNEIIVLVPGSVSGLYQGSATTPVNPGEYGIDVVLVDELGNEATYSAAATVTVSADGAPPPTEEPPTEEPPTDDPPTEEPPAEVPSGDNVPPSQVFGVIAYGSDDRVTLVWEAASDDTLVDHYKIYYSADPTTLEDSAVETMDASTTWFVPDLENGTEYYFAVSAIDNEGLEGATKSETVSGIPFSLDLEDEVPDRADGEVTPSEEDDGLLKSAAAEGIPEMTKNGPGLIWLIGGTGVAGYASRLLARKKKK
ncbi:Ig-like domain-containing protein [Pseudomonadota bacterium]